MRSDPQENVRFNFGVHVGEAAGFGLAMGLASFTTVIPLFVANLTESSVLIGLISAMRMVGWQLPSLLTANRVARLRRYKPMVILMTLNERLPFFGLALVALLLPRISRDLALVLTFIFVMWQSFGGGLTGVAWLSMVVKIIPARLRGRFFGIQMSVANLLSSGGAILAGLILKAVGAPESFAVCFFLAGVSLLVSFAFLTQAREADTAPARETAPSPREFWRGLRSILRRDGNFRLFIAARIFAQIASVGLAFFTIYAVRHFSMDVATAGIMTGVLLIAQVFANLLFGWLGDRYSHRLMYAAGVLLAGAGALTALAAPGLEWFYLVFALAGAANAGLVPTSFALTLEFGTDAERPYYIGLSNTLVAPATLLAPILGGWIADTVGYGATFGLAAAASIVTVLIVLLMMGEPDSRRVPAGVAVVEPT